MRKYFLAAAPLLMIASLAACTAPPEPGAKVTASDTFSRDMGRNVHNISVFAALGPEFSAEEAGKFQTTMIARLNRCNIAAQYTATTPAAIDTITGAGPAAVLKVSAMGNGAYTASMTDPTDQTVVIRSNMSVDNGAHIGEAFSRTIINDLILDHAISDTCLVGAPIYPS